MVPYISGGWTVMTCRIVGKKLKDWKPPTKREVDDNNRHVKRLRMAEDETN